MRELTMEEMDEVVGGVGPVGAAIGVAVGAGSAAVQGGNAGEIIAGGILGGASGFFGGLATASGVGGFGRSLLATFAVETGIMSGSVTS